VSRRFDALVRKCGKKIPLDVRLAGSFDQFGGVRRVTDSTGRKTTLLSPRLYDAGLSEIRQPQISVASPDVTLVEMKDVQVIGSTMAVIRGGSVFHPELLVTQPSHDNKTPGISRFTDEVRQSLRFDVFTRPVAQKRVRIGFHMLKEHSFNYYHWLAECLPRLAYFCENQRLVAEDAEITILIDHFIPEQCIEAMRRIINFAHTIKVVRRGELVQCDRLFYVSPFWFAFDNSKNQVNAERDYAVDREAIQLVRKSLVQKRSTAAPTRKIYLPRTASQVRRIINSSEVEQLMRDNGFEILLPHTLSFVGQVELFSSIKVLIGASGAAFANMLFMQPGSKAVIFSPKQLDVFNYYIFQQHADVAGVELMHMLTRPEKPDDFFVHDNFYVDCNDLKSLLKRLP
jgi:hypothetical protein